MLILLGVIYTTSYKISLSGTGKYVSGDPSKDSPLHLVPIEEADSFNFRSDTDLPEKVYITLSKNTFLAWKIQDTTHNDFSSNKLVNELIYSPLEREKNHMFRIVPIDFFKKTYWIGNDVITNCLTWDKLKYKFEMRKCDKFNNDQLFEILPIQEKENSIKVSKNTGDRSDDKEPTIVIHDKDLPTLQDVEKSHRLENEGENLISTIYDILNKLDVCLSRTGSCGSYDEALKSLYKRSAQSSSGSQSSSSSSSSSRSASYSAASAASAAAYGIRRSANF